MKWTITITGDYEEVKAFIDKFEESQTPADPINPDAWLDSMLFGIENLNVSARVRTKLVRATNPFDWDVKGRIITGYCGSFSSLEQWATFEQWKSYILKHPKDFDIKGIGKKGKAELLEALKNETPSN